jgi:23S rRNA pseudouridine1911/1915/1917 synthase
MAIRVSVLYRDNHLVLVNKPSGVLSQPDSTGAPCMADLVRSRLQCSYVATLHRLDRDASGVMVFATTSKAASRMAHKFKTHQISKTYQVVVEGKHWDFGVQGVIKGDLVNRDSELRWRWLGGLDFFGGTALEVKITSGRKHQIRRQLVAGLGRAVVGDGVYGTSSLRCTLMLHASKLEFDHPIHGHEFVSVEKEAWWW